MANLHFFKNKRAVTFTIVAILLSFLFISLYELNNSQSMLVLNDPGPRIFGIDNFISDFESDFGNVIYIIGFRSLLGMEQYVISNGTYIDNLNQSFSSLFMNGTIDGKNSTIMLDSYFENWFDVVKKQAEEKNINIEINNISVFPYQDNETGPWAVGVFAKINYSLYDERGFASWNRTIEDNKTISILGFEDPLYVINSYGRMTNYINISPYLGHFVSGYNVTNLSLNLEKGYYIASSSAPDYLDRLSGNLNASPEGIESLVDVALLSLQGIPVNTQKSDVDYIYFSNNNPVSYNVTGMPYWFRLDNLSNHLDIYQVENLIIK